jgi:SAM-dependent methyltransferase
MHSLRAFFEHPSADRLMDRATLPQNIRQFLRQERLLLDSLAGSFDRLIEVGCMDGRHLEWACAHGRRYVGIDIAERHIKRARVLATARGLSTQACRFLVGEAEAIDALIEPLQEPATRDLVFLPFNIFGAVSDANRVIHGLRRSRRAFLISAYQTNERATASREQYYRRCGYEGLRLERDLCGVSFVTASGFRTTAYEPDYLQALCRALDLPVTAITRTWLNVAYLPSWFVAGVEPLRSTAGSAARRWRPIASPTLFVG